MDMDMIPEIFMIALLAAAVLVPPALILRGKSEKKFLLLLVWVLVLVWAARMSVSMQPGFYDGVELNAAEKILDSFVHTLQTFSMDEDYTLYTSAGKMYLEQAGMPCFAFVYGLVISGLNVLAPVLGGAILLDLLMSFFPNLRLLMGIRRHKFVFSELNQASVTLAEDIWQDEKYRCLIHMDRFDRKPMIVFSDAYLDDEQESSAELHRRAGAIGAVCMKKDILEFSLARSKSVSYFLVDRDAHTNLSTLAQLLEPCGDGRLRWPAELNGDEPVTRIFVFRQDDSGNALVRKICADHQDAYDRVVVRPIQDLTNAALNLMYDVPLFLPLLSKPEQDRQDLCVTILGSSALAEEAFRTVYWCGQIAGVRLRMNVVAPEAAAMEARIRNGFPELLESCRKGAPLLRVRPHDPQGICNPPYCEDVQFYDTADAGCVAAYPGDVLRNTDYFIVALGADQENLRVADQLKVLITRELMGSRNGAHPVIAPALWDPCLARAAQILKPGPCEPYLVPFASIKSRYSCKNVFLTNFTEQEITIKSIYQKKHQQKDRRDIYATQSSAARLVHAPYKLFGLGLLGDVDLTVPTARRYRVDRKISLNREQEDQFAWVEHRRWNAYLRSQGFICPTREQYDALFARTGATKSVPLKLHPCLVESQVEPVPLEVLPAFTSGRYDYLDYVTMYTYRLESVRNGTAETTEALQDRDYKKYDYLCYDAGVADLLPPQ